MADRIDSLLEEALATGAVPADASPAERAEIEAALRAAGVLRANATAAQEEAASTMPTARARFERFIAAEAAASRPAPVVVARPAGGLFGRLFGRQRAFAFGAVAAVLVVVAAAALFVPRPGGDGGVQTASAQVLEPGDYTQVEGVVEEVSGEGETYDLLVRSYHATLRIAISGATVVGEDGAGVPLKAGDSVLVGGVVQDDLSVSASTLSANVTPVDVVPAGADQPPRLLAAQVGSGVRGKVLTFALTRDGRTARVLLQLEDGRRALAWVDARSAERLMLRASAVGAVVTAKPAAEGKDLFVLEVADAGNPGEVAAAAPLRFTGVITSRAGNVLTVATNRGEVRVTIVPATIILVGESGLDRSAIRRGEGIVGHAVAVAGSRGPRGLTIIADVVALGATAGP